MQHFIAKYLQAKGWALKNGVTLTTSCHNKKEAEYISTLHLHTPAVNGAFITSYVPSRSIARLIPSKCKIQPLTECRTLQHYVFAFCTEYEELRHAIKLGLNSACICDIGLLSQFKSMSNFTEIQLLPAGKILILAGRHTDRQNVPLRWSLMREYSKIKQVK